MKNIFPPKTRQDVLEALALLALEFNIPTPTLKWSERTTSGRAHPRSNQISLGHLAWRGLENAMLHEFAHILTFQRHGPSVSNHGKEFNQALWDTVKAWLDDPSEYAWGTEYTTVHAYGRKRGAVKR